jgi:exodeoxyribonuclease VII large subunit
VLVWPVRVQGDTCGQEVARAIRGFNALPEGGRVPRPDVIIVARGGGSLEDLWGFNDEIVVRAAAESMIPLVSAVGHETDWTLIDHAADVRAPTPTAAAEITVPVRSEMLAQTAALGRRLAGAVARLRERRRADVRALVRALPGPEDLLATSRQRLDRAGEMLPARLRAGLSARQVRLGRLGALVSRHSPGAELARRRERLAQFGARLSGAFAATVRAHAERAGNGRVRLASLEARLRNAQRAGNEARARHLAATVKLLVSLSHKSVLARGYAIVRDGGADGAPLRSASAVSLGQAVTLEFSDGTVAAVAGEGAPSPAPGGAPPARSKPGRLRGPDGPGGGQGSLF